MVLGAVFHILLTVISANLVLIHALLPWRLVGLPRPLDALFLAFLDCLMQAWFDCLLFLLPNLSEAGLVVDCACRPASSDCKSCLC